MGLGMPIASAYPTGSVYPVKFRYSIGLFLPIGVKNPAAANAWIIADGLIILAGEIRRRFSYPDGTHANLVGRGILLDCTSPAGEVAMGGFFSISY